MIVVHMKVKQKNSEAQKIKAKTCKNKREQVKEQIGKRRK